MGPVDQGFSNCESRPAIKQLSELNRPRRRLPEEDAPPAGFCPGSVALGLPQCAGWNESNPR
jgi:hypothetical protein